MPLAKDIERAIRLAQVYQGSSGTTRVSDQQRIYIRLQKAVTSVAKRRDMSEADVFEQVSAAASARGAIMPIPGKDY